MSTLQFPTALDTWFAQHPHHSLRALASAAHIDNSLLSLIRRGKRPITQDALAQLLPAIEHASTRRHALTLLLAYLRDETPPEYLSELRLEIIDQTTGGAGLDTYAALSHEWEQLARYDAKFHAVWAGLDAYIHHPDRLADHLSDRSHGADPETQVALLAEPSPHYGAQDATAAADLRQTPSPATAPSAASGSTTKGSAPTQGTKKHTRKTADKAPAATAPIVPLRQHITPGPGAGIEQAAQ